MFYPIESDVIDKLNKNQKVKAVFIIKNSLAGWECSHWQVDQEPKSSNGLYQGPTVD